MTRQSQPIVHAYAVAIAFQSDGIPYAREVYEVEAVDEYDAERQARMRAEESAYHDRRIPGLGLEVQVEEIGSAGSAACSIGRDAGALSTGDDA